MLFISHDIALLAQIASRIVVMYAGQIVESGPRDAIVEQPLHPYTRALIGAVERMDAAGEERLEAIAGDPPDLRSVPTRLPVRASVPTGHGSLPHASTRRSSKRQPGQSVACHLYLATTDEEAAA